MRIYQTTPVRTCGCNQGITAPAQRARTVEVPCMDSPCEARTCCNQTREVRTCCEQVRETIPCCNQPRNTDTCCNRTRNTDTCCNRNRNTDTCCNQPRNTDTCCNKTRNTNTCCNKTRNTDTCCNRTRDTDTCCNQTRDTDTCCNQTRNTDTCCNQTRDTDTCCNKTRDTDTCCRQPREGRPCDCPQDDLAIVNAVKQHLCDMYQPAQALTNGTLFEDLNKPMAGYCAQGIPDCMSTGQSLAFVAWELRLYLDTHPDDMEALDLFRRVAARAGDPNYATTFVPQCEDCEWRWVQGPWPWEYDNCGRAQGREDCGHVCV